MLNGRIYRAAAIPFLLALAIAALSLGGRPLPYTSTFAPDAFDGERAITELRSLAARFPDRRPGSAGDEELAEHVARTFEELGSTGTHSPEGWAGGFAVRTHRFQAQTIAGERALRTIVAERPGSTNAKPILILAHRDAAARGSQAELSGTAVLLELARVFAARETKRTIVLASTSGGSGGAAGAAELAAERPQIAQHGPFDAAIALGDLAGARSRGPYVVPFSDGVGSAPLQLQRTVADAIRHEAGSDPGSPSALGQLAHLVFPLTLGEQGVLNRDGLPSVLVQVSGERGPAPRDPVSEARLQAFGRAVLSALDALDTAPDVSQTMQTGLLLRRKTMPGWALRLLVGTLLLPSLIAAVDGLARARRRRLPVGRWTMWTLSCALPFFTCALFVYLFGWLGILGATPAAPVLPSALPFDGKDATAVAAVLLTFALAWMLWSMLVRRLHWGVRPDPEVAGLGVLLALLALALVLWVSNPLSALLLAPALHLWLLLASPELRPRRPVSLVLVALGLLPLALLVAFYAHQLGLGAGGAISTAVLLLSSGHVGFIGAVLWSLAFGCVAAAAMLAVRPWQPPPGPLLADGVEVTIRGPMTYAGPGSLGGTESALRR